MPNKQHSFVIPDDQSIPALISLLQTAFSVRVVDETVFHRVFFDTFDWRLSKKGSALEVHDHGPSSSPSSSQPSSSGSRIYWRADKDSRLKIQLGLNTVPRLASDLPACEFRQQLQSVISVRELSPRIRTRIKRQSLAVLDENEKIVVRLNFDEYRYSPSKLRAARVLAKRLTIKEVKGYSSDLQQVKAFFTDTSPSEPLPEQLSEPLPTPLPMPLIAAQDNVMNLALIAGGMNTGEYSTSLKLRLDPDMPDEQAAKIILLRLLEILQQNTAGCIKASDTEFLRDYRVVIRKTRLLLKQLKHDEQAVVSEYEPFFSGLDELTDPVRNLDLFLMQLSGDQAEFSDADRQQLQVLRDYLLQLRTEQQNKLSEELKSSRYRETIKQWRNLLECAAGDDAADKIGEAVHKLSDELLPGLNQKILKQGKTIVDNKAKHKAANSDVESLRGLCETCEQLCYSIAFFSSLYPAKEMREVTKLLTDIQDSLGVVNDRNIQISMLQAFIKQSKDKQAIKASEQLLKTFGQQLTNAATNLKDAYSVYASPASKKKVKELFINYRRGKMKL